MILASAGPTAALRADTGTTDTIASQFLAAWGKARNHHDVAALDELHTANAVSVIRFGTLLVGRAPTEKALGFLHSEQGPFGHSTFPPLKLLEARSITPEVVIVNAAWKNPVMRPDGKISQEKWNDTIVTYVLVRDGQMWKASEVDAHNFEKMELPFSNPGQKS
jgi:hypothetical protein